jgi:hypothetical protein
MSTSKFPKSVEKYVLDANLLDIDNEIGPNDEIVRYLNSKTKKKLIHLLLLINKRKIIWRN